MLSLCRIKSIKNYKIDKLIMYMYIIKIQKYDTI